MIKIALIGCGNWGRNHIRVFCNLPGAKVVACADIDEKSLSRAQGLFPEIQCVTDWRELIRRPNVDAVVIASPTSTHYALGRSALQAGKHVLCEKPLCLTKAEAQELAETAWARNLVLMVGHVFLFNAGICKMKELLVEGEIGTVCYLSATRTNLGPVRHDVGAAYDLATHDISIFNWLLDSQPVSVSASGGAWLQPGIEDVVFITLEYPRNVRASIQASWLSPKKVRHITVVGSKKMVTWDDLELNTPVAIYDKGANSHQEYSDYGEFLRVSMWDGDVRLPKVHLEEPLKVQDRYFLEAILRGRVQCSDGAFAIGVVNVLEAVHESLNLGGRPTEVSDEQLIHSPDGNR